MYSPPEYMYITHPIIHESVYCYFSPSQTTSTWVCHDEFCHPKHDLMEDVLLVIVQVYFDGLVQERCNSSTLAMKLRFSLTHLFDTHG